MLFSPPLSLDVPVMPRIRKYLQVLYPAGIELTPTDSRLFQIWALVQTEKIKVRANGRTAQPMTDIVQLVVRQTNGSRRLALLTDMEAKMVNKMLDLMIYQEFYNLVARNSRRNIGISATIRAFVDTYDFSEEELAEQTLRIAYHRHRSAGHIGFEDAQLLGTALQLVA